MTPRPWRRWLAAACAAVTVAVGAATPEGRAPTARQRFEAARSAETAARAAATLVDDSASDAAQERALTQVRRVAAQYETLVRRFPTSGYSDDALFQAGTLLHWLHGRFGREADRSSSAKYLAWLLREYPASKHVREAKVAARALDHPVPRAETVEARASQPPAAVPVAAKAPVETPSGPPTLRGISRAVLDDTVRITLALDREAPFTHETLSGPPRAFVDLFGATTNDALQDASVKYDADAVWQVRVGRRQGAVRVVLDLTAPTRVSVYTLYNPFRIVIDADRGKPSRPVAVPTAVAAAPLAGRRAAPAVTPASTPPAPPRPAVTRSSPRVSPVPAPEPLPAPVALPAEPAVVLTVESPGDPPAPQAAANVGDAPLLDPSPVVLPPEREPSPSSTAAATTTVPPAPAPPTAPTPVPGPIDAAESAPPEGTSAPSRPPTAPSANTDGSFSLARQLGLGISRIVIDPGHGGHDPGTLAHGTSEARLVLDVALRLEKLLEREGLEVVLTRRTDVFIPLEERTAIANRERADLFLSIHANASRNPKARGIETYYLSFASNPDAETVAARENATSSGGMHNLPSIVRAIALNNKLDESRDLAGMVQRALSAQLSKGADGSRSRGIKKAPFVVLIGAAMPSVLAEIGFITNRTEAGFIKTPAYRQRIADALRNAVLQYQRSLKRATTVASVGR